MRWTTLFMLLVCVLFALGGSFECRGKSGSVDWSTTEP